MPVSEPRGRLAPIQKHATLGPTHPPMLIAIVAFLLPAAHGAIVPPCLSTVGHARTALEATLAEDEDKLDRALDAVRIPRLRSDLAFLADDQMRGRDTPSPELRIAALYIAARLERLGFQSAGSGDYFYRYPLWFVGLDADASSLELRSDSASEQLAFGSDYILSRMSHAYSATTDAHVVSVGTGSKDEFESASLAGSWALLFDEGASIRRTMRYASRQGALGVLIAETPSSPHPFLDKYRSTTSALLRQRTTNDEPPASRGADGKDAVPVVLLLAPTVTKLLALAGDAGASGRIAAGTELDLEATEHRVVRNDRLSELNVAGFWPGRDPALAGEVIIVSAHYDHVGVNQDDIYNGADDNASGSTGLLAIAEALAAYGPMRRSVLLLWVSGEEKGLWGSAAWTAAPQLPPGHTACADINIDMIGRTAPSELYITPTDAHASFNAVSQSAYDLSALEGFDSLLSQDADWKRSDHYNFDRHLKIPVAFLSAGEHPDYHKPTDTVDKIDFDKLSRITRLVIRMLDRIEDGPLK